MQVSVVIATYNGSRFVREALESVFAQSCLPCEIVVVDDFSTDNTIEVIEQAAQDSPVPVRLIRLESNSGGPVHPMNVGIEAAAGDVICTLDHDDLMEPRKVELHRLALDDESVGLAFGPAGALKEGIVQPPKWERYEHTALCSRPTAQEKVRLLEADVAFDRLLRNGYNYGGAGGSSFRKQAWQTLGGFDESYRIVWDYDFALRLTRAGFRVAYCEEAAYLHRFHESNLEFSLGGIRLARETVQLFSKHALSDGLPPAAALELRRCLAVMRLELVWKLRQQRRFGEAFRELGLSLRQNGFSIGCAKEFLKTAAATILPRRAPGV